MCCPACMHPELLLQLLLLPLPRAARRQLGTASRCLNPAKALEVTTDLLAAIQPQNACADRQRPCYRCCCCFMLTCTGPPSPGPSHHPSAGLQEQISHLVYLDAG
jgi:hypothetical protein